MFKALIIAAAVLAAPLAHASPQDDPDLLPQSRSLAGRLGDSIHQATDRASALVTSAMSAIGVPYRRGGESADTGFDCSGFVRATFEQAMGLVLPRRAEEQAAAASKISRADLQPGDLVFFNTLRRAYSHVGIYLGDGQFIHAPRTGSRVRVESMELSYWKKRFNGARRVPGVETDAAALRTSSVLNRETPAPSAVRLGGGAGAKMSEDVWQLPSERAARNNGNGNGNI
ncbi:C40 family peptidase [Ottowia sp.]|uniref:C40 family peptidase n=1 Tax=Ottowia sp. TaxID=1898956 RepID=UPI00396482FF|nr:C40 family peptidase [Pseudomonadota bacterium]